MKELIQMLKTAIPSSGILHVCKGTDIKVAYFGHSYLWDVLRPHVMEFMFLRDERIPCCIEMNKNNIIFKCGPFTIATIEV